jgi:hypothetical protein
MSVHDALPGDVYADAEGRLWRVTAICQEPSVEVEAVEDLSPDGKPLRRSGGVSGLMWQGFRRVWRHSEDRPGE